MAKLIFGFAFARILTLTLAQDCYWPNGEKASSAFKACNNKAGTCCYRLDDAHTDLCYDNGLCYSAFFGNVYRGACTSKSWDRSSGCASQCLTYNSGGESPISPCADRSLCCGASENATSCCENKSGFLWNNATLVLSLASASNSQTSGSSSATPNIASSPNQNSAQGATVSGRDNEIALKAGLGTALAVSLFAIIILLFLLFGQRRRKQPVQLPYGTKDAPNGPAPWVYGYEASTIAAPSVVRERPQTPVMLSDSEIHELDSHRRATIIDSIKDSSIRHTVTSIPGSDAASFHERDPAVISPN